MGRYELLARIATGGMGEIFLARFEGAAGFEKLCVVKRILPHLADDSRFRTMLIGEARIASSMAHANICHVYELDEFERQLYMVMEYLEGVTVLQLLRAFSRSRRQLDYGLILGLVQQACEGLHYAHELRDRNGHLLSVVHRDVTPSNLFLTKTGVLKVVDFGIAKVTDAANTDSGAVKGKYAYMAPEQLRGQPVDRRADVFSLGVVVAEMLTCRRLYQRKTDYLTWRAVMEQPMVEIREHRPDAPDGIKAVLQRAVDRDPDARYATVRQFGAALLEAFGGVRPWTSREIGELVMTTFGDELAQHDAEIARILQQCSPAQLHAIPLIKRRETESAEAEQFALDPNSDQMPSSDPGMISQPPGGSRPGVARQSTQMPRVQHKRPMAPGRPSALPMVSIIGAAAALLAVGVLLVDRHAARAPRPAAAAAAPPAVDGPRTVDRIAVPRAGANEPYAVAVRGRARDLDECARLYREALPASAQAVIRIDPSGRPTRVALLPEASDRQPLCGCIRDVLQGIAFPSAPAEMELALGLAVNR
jgi:serine/threonine protein kinase